MSKIVASVVVIVIIVLIIAAFVSYLKLFDGVPTLVLVCIILLSTACPILFLVFGILSEEIVRTFKDEDT